MLTPKLRAVTGPADTGFNWRASTLPGRRMSDPPKQQLLEMICARRAFLTVIFAFSGGVVLVAVGLVVLADISPSSRAIAIVDIGISGCLFAASLYLIRQCNRLKRGDR